MILGYLCLGEQHSMLVNDLGYNGLFEYLLKFVEEHLIKF